MANKVVDSSKLSFLNPAWVAANERDEGGSPPAQTRYRCTGSPNYQCVEDPNGPYGSLAECQASCKAPTCPTGQHWDEAQGKCVDNVPVPPDNPLPPVDQYLMKWVNGGETLTYTLDVNKPCTFIGFFISGLTYGTDAQVYWTLPNGTVLPRPDGARILGMDGGGVLKIEANSDAIPESTIPQGIHAVRIVGNATQSYLKFGIQEMS